MFSHVTLGSSDLTRSRLFYDAVMAVIGCAPSDVWPDGRLRYFMNGVMLTILEPIDGSPPESGNGHTLGFRMADPAMADRWHHEGVRHGGVSVEGLPGVRARPFGNIYLAYLRDPDGNKLCGMVEVD